MTPSETTLTNVNDPTDLLLVVVPAVQQTLLFLQEWLECFRQDASNRSAAWRLARTNPVSDDISPDLGQGGTNHPRKDRVWKKINVCYVEVCDAFPKVSPSLLQAKRALNLEK